MLRDRARGIDPRDLDLDAERVSISVEETFERDIADRADAARRAAADGGRGGRAICAAPGSRRAP